MNLEINNNQIFDELLDLLPSHCVCTFSKRAAHANGTTYMVHRSLASEWENRDVLRRRRGAHNVAAAAQRTQCGGGGALNPGAAHQARRRRRHCR